MFKTKLIRVELFNYQAGMHTIAGCFLMAQMIESERDDEKTLKIIEEIVDDKLPNLCKLQSVDIAQDHEVCTQIHQEVAVD